MNLSMDLWLRITGLVVDAVTKIKGVENLIVVTETDFTSNYY